jgi:hypothetical protein
VGAVPIALARDIKDRISITRAVETGTYRGGSARALAEVFAQVVSIELSQELHDQARAELSDLTNVELFSGDSRELLRTLVTPTKPTFYWLDGHWSGGEAAGVGSECPLLDELAAIANGHQNDSIVIDDARFFTTSPPPPHDPAQWPTLVQVIDALRQFGRSRFITLINDLVIAVPDDARSIVDEWARRETSAPRRRWPFVPR